MKYTTRIKPISYVKSTAAEIIRELAERREPLVIAQNGEARAVTWTRSHSHAYLRICAIVNFTRSKNLRSIGLSKLFQASSHKLRISPV